MKKLRVYKLQIDESDTDSSGVDTISIVRNPAIQSHFVEFSETEKPHREYFTMEIGAKGLVLVKKK